MTNPNLRRTFGFAVAVLIVVPVLAVSPSVPQLPDPGRVGMSRDEQRKLGLQAAAEVYKQMPVLPDSDPITQYVQRLGKKLVKQIPPQYSWPYEFHVIQQKEINAFALPGGPIFVNIGTISAAQNEAQLAGVARWFVEPFLSWLTGSHSPHFGYLAAGSDRASLVVTRR